MRLPNLRRIKWFSADLQNCRKRLKDEQQTETKISADFCDL